MREYISEVDRAKLYIGDLDYDIVGNVYAEPRPRLIGMQLGPGR